MEEPGQEQNWGPLPSFLQVLAAEAECGCEPHWDFCKEVDLGVIPAPLASCGSAGSEVTGEVLT